MQRNSIQERPSPQADDRQYSAAEIEQFDADLREIRRHLRLKSLLGERDVVAEIGAEVLADRLAQMRREVQP